MKKLNLILIILSILTSLWIAGIGYNIAASNPFTSSGWVLHTQVVYRQIQKTMNDVVVAESNERGYLVTGNTEYLDRYREAIPAYYQHMKVLSWITRDSPLQQEHCAALQKLIDLKFKNMENKVALYHEGPKAQQKIKESIAFGTKLMNDSLIIFENMENEEDRLLVERDAKSKITLYSLFFAMGFIIVQNVAMCYGVYRDGL